MMTIRPFLPCLLCFPLIGACACTKNDDAGMRQIAEQIVISPRDFDRSYRLSCAKNSDCALPLVCDGGLCMVPPSVTNTTTDRTPRLTFRTAAGERSIFLEIVADDYGRQKGMMNRKTCHPGWGMLFIFPNQARRSFWMSHTYLPLDIIFIDKNGKVSNFYQNAVPLDERPRYTSDARVRYVLELPGGSAARLGIDETTAFNVAPFDDYKAE